MVQGAPCLVFLVQVPRLADTMPTRRAGCRRQTDRAGDMAYLLRYAASVNVVHQRTFCHEFVMPIDEGSGARQAVTFERERVIKMS